MLRPVPPPDHSRPRRQVVPRRRRCRYSFNGAAGESIASWTERPNTRHDTRNTPNGIHVCMCTFRHPNADLLCAIRSTLCPHFLWPCQPSHGTAHRRPTTDHRRRITDDGRPTTDRQTRRPTIGNHRRESATTGDDRRPATTDGGARGGLGVVVAHGGPGARLLRSEAVVRGLARRHARRHGSPRTGCAGTEAARGEPEPKQLRRGARLCALLGACDKDNHESCPYTDPATNPKRPRIEPEAGPGRPLSGHNKLALGRRRIAPPPRCKIGSKLPLERPRIDPPHHGSIPNSPRSDLASTPTWSRVDLGSTRQQPGR